MKVLTQKELISSLKVDNNIMFLLGAGCSISSGCMAASDLVENLKFIYIAEIIMLEKKTLWIIMKKVF